MLFWSPAVFVATLHESSSQARNVIMNVGNGGWELRVRHLEAIHDLTGAGTLFYEDSTWNFVRQSLESIVARRPFTHVDLYCGSTGHFFVY